MKGNFNSKEIVLILFPEQMAFDTDKGKCPKVLANLLRLTRELPEPGSTKVNMLVQDLIDAKVEPEEFTMKLHREFRWLILLLKVIQILLSTFLSNLLKTRFYVYRKTCPICDNLWLHEPYILTIFDHQPYLQSVLHGRWD